MARKDEAKLQDKFIALLKKENILYIKTDGGLKYYPKRDFINHHDGTYSGIFTAVKSPEGFADIIVFTSVETYDCQGNKELEAQTLFIEVKTDIGQLRSSQIKKFNELKELGFNCFVLRPDYWERAKKIGKLSFKNILLMMEREWY